MVGGTFVIRGSRCCSGVLDGDREVIGGVNERGLRYVTRIVGHGGNWGYVGDIWIVVVEI